VDSQRKHAYRWLLYWAMLDIRPLQWAGAGWRQRLNPFCWWSNSRRVRVAGGIAEWLHNLAMYSALDFAGFEEERFWRDYEWLLGQNPGHGLERYRAEFKRRASSAETPGAEPLAASGPAK
jgi:hypothetical protein